MGSRYEPPAGAEALVEIGSEGQRLVVLSGGPTELWDAWILVEAYPFSGVIRTTLTQDDVAKYRSALSDFDRIGRTTLGGHRAPQIDLTRDGDVIEVGVTPSGDDPWPTIRYLIFTNVERDPTLVKFPKGP
jgi:hypothetical protein